jgi:hypothetical protein
MTMTERERLQAELAEAERALAASIKATSTHGHQSITWAFLRIDSRRVDDLRCALAAEIEREAQA